MSTAHTRFRAYTRDVSRRFFGLAVILPLAAAVVALGTGRADALNLVHVTAGAAWAGATLYLVGVLSPTLMTLDPGVRAQLTVPLIPKHILLYSSLALVTLVTGASLAGVTGRDNTAPVMIAAWLVGVALLVVAAYLIRVQGQIYGEVHGEAPDMGRVGSLAANLGKAGMLGAALQVVTLVVMALVRVA
jgi:hypothetical protein